MPEEKMSAKRLAFRKKLGVPDDRSINSSGLIWQGWDLGWQAALAYQLDLDVERCQLEAEKLRKMAAPMVGPAARPIQAMAAICCDLARKLREEGR